MRRAALPSSTAHLHTPVIATVSRPDRPPPAQPSRTLPAAPIMFSAGNIHLHLASSRGSATPAQVPQPVPPEWTPTVEFLEVPTGLAGCVIGKQGSTQKALRRTTGAKVWVERGEEVSRCGCMGCHRQPTPLLLSSVAELVELGLRGGSVEAWRFMCAGGTLWEGNVSCVRWHTRDGG